MPRRTTGSCTCAAGGVVRLDRGDGMGRQLLARYGRAPRDNADTIRVPLTVQRPYAGELELDAAPEGYALALGTMVAERFSLHLENDRLRRADIRRQTWITFLAEASELLAQSLDVNLTMALIPQLVVDLYRGRWVSSRNLSQMFHSIQTGRALPTWFTAQSLIMNGNRLVWVVLVIMVNSTAAEILLANSPATGNGGGSALHRLRLLRQKWRSMMFLQACSPT